MAQTAVEALSPAQASRVAHEISEHFGTRIEAPQVRAMARVARTSDPDVLRFVARFLSLVAAKPVRREEIVAGLTKAMALVTEAPAGDPLRGVDEALPRADATGSVARAEAEATSTRRAILRECVTAEEAARLTRRSRQSLERFRRAGRVLALRERNQWLYPRWQFLPDAAGGIVDGLGPVLKELGLAPAGAAYWLGRRHRSLGGSPIALLRSGRREAVVAAAREQGERV